MNLLFQDPPDDRRNGGPQVRHLGVAEELRANPGKWALVFTNVAQPTVTSIRTGRLKAFSPPGAFEATSRLVDGVVHIWVRYVGPT